MLEAYRGPWFSINWMKSASRWFHYIEVVSQSVSQPVSQYVSQSASHAYLSFQPQTIPSLTISTPSIPTYSWERKNKGLHGSNLKMTATSGPKTLRRPHRLAVQDCSEWKTLKKSLCLYAAVMLTNSIRRSWMVHGLTYSWMVHGLTYSWMVHGLTYSWMTYGWTKPLYCSAQCSVSAAQPVGKEVLGVKTTALLHLVCGSYTAISPIHLHGSEGLSF
jgi:hypothetical protein